MVSPENLEQCNFKAEITEGLVCISCLITSKSWLPFSTATAITSGSSFHTLSEFLLSLVELEVQDASFYPLVTGSLDFCTADLFSVFFPLWLFPFYIFFPSEISICQNLCRVTSQSFCGQETP